MAAAAAARAWTRAGAVALALTIVAGVSLALAAPSGAAGDLGPGCDPTRPAIAHTSDGSLVSGQPVRVPCATETGAYTGETTIGVADDGTVWFSAADWEWALSRTRDDGATWETFEVPGPQARPGCVNYFLLYEQECDTSQQSKNNTVADAFLWVDPATSRVFWTKTYGYALCASMNFSDDGEDWTAVEQWGCPGGDYEKINGGPAPAGTEQPTGYPNVLYGCTNGPAPTFVVGPSRVCYKSLDGGVTWGNTGVPVTPSPQAPGCLHFQETHVVGPDGTIFLPLGCALDTSTIFLAYSTDQATTWNYVPVPIGGIGNGAGLIGGVSVAVDETGRAYVLWTGLDRRAHVVSTDDLGATWTGPFTASAPGVTIVAPLPQVATRDAGHIALAYYGHPDEADGTVLNGYLTESSDADGADPVFHSAQLNRDDDPLYFPTDGGSLPRNDYLGVTIGPDGTPWTALVKLSTATSDDEGFIQSTGFAGRLVAGEVAPAPLAEPAPQVDAAPAPAPLPTTGGGLALAAILAIGAGVTLRRR